VSGALQKRGRAAEQRGKKAEERNTGVEARAAKDKASIITPASRDKEVYDRLLKKSKIYDKLGRDIGRVCWRVVVVVAAAVVHVSGRVVARGVCNVCA
jgi:hypothetical protein